jgi:hypothetical protein
MYFDEGRNLKHPQYKRSEAHHLINSAEQTEREGCGHNRQASFAPLRQVSGNDPGKWQAGKVLDVTNNKLQELMQLLYLLGRDPAVPQNARHHVTVAQSEIALLSRLMQNAPNPQDDKPKPPAAAAGL